MPLANPVLVGSDGWISDSSETWTEVSATSFKISGLDVTEKYTPGTKLKLTQTTVKYFYVVSSSFSTDTTVTVTGGSDYSLAAATISSNYHSYAAGPQGFPDTFNWTPSPTGFSGSPTITARFSIVGRKVFALISVSGTSNATTKTFTLPVSTTSIGSNFLYPAGFTENNSSVLTTPGRIGLANSSTTATVSKDMGNTAWTASGTCIYVCAFDYEFA